MCDGVSIAHTRERCAHVLLHTEARAVENGREHGTASGRGANVGQESMGGLCRWCAAYTGANMGLAGGCVVIGAGAMSALLGTRGGVGASSPWRPARAGVGAVGSVGVEGGVRCAEMVEREESGERDELLRCRSARATT